MRRWWWCIEYASRKGVVFPSHWAVYRPLKCFVSITNIHWHKLYMLYITYEHKMGWLTTYVRIGRDWCLIYRGSEAFHGSPVYLVWLVIDKLTSGSIDWVLQQTVVTYLGVRTLPSLDQSAPAWLLRLLSKEQASSPMRKSWGRATLMLRWPSEVNSSTTTYARIVVNHMRVHIHVRILYTQDLLRPWEIFLHIVYYTPQYMYIQYNMCTF